MYFSYVFVGYYGNIVVYISLGEPGVEDDVSAGVHQKTSGRSCVLATEAKLVLNHGIKIWNWEISCNNTKQVVLVWVACYHGNRLADGNDDSCSQRILVWSGERQLVGEILRFRKPVKIKWIYISRAFASWKDDTNGGISRQNRFWLFLAIKLRHLVIPIALLCTVHECFLRFSSVHKS